MTVIAARRSANRSFVYLEGEDYIVVKARQNTAGIFAKQKPFITGSYCDDLAVASALIPPGAELVVLGGSIGSTFPLSFECNPRLTIVSVDHDAEVTQAGQHFNARVLEPSQARAIQWLVQPVNELSDAVFRDAGAVFIDLYTSDELSPVVYDPRLHSRIVREARPDAVVLLNIFDVLYAPDRACPTRFVLARLAPFYRSFLLWRRRRASVVVCARESLDRLKERLGAALERAVSVGVTRPDMIEQPLPPSVDSSTWDSSRFSLPAQVAYGGPGDRGGPDDSLIVRAERDVSKLTVADILVLLKARSSFLDFQLAECPTTA